MSNLRIALVYSDGLQEGGYPRDIRGLVDGLQRGGTNAALVAVPGQHSDGLPTDAVLMARQAQSVNWDVIHHFGLFIPSQWRVTFRLRGRALVVSPAAQLMGWHLRRRAWKKLPYAYALKLALQRRRPVVHVFSDRELPGVRRYLRPRATFQAGLGVWPAPSDDGSLLLEEPGLLFLGRNDVFQKGIDLLLGGYAQAVRAGLDLPLTICGRPEGRNDAIIRATVAQLGLAGKVFMIGEVTEKEKWSLLRRARCLVFLSRWDGPPRPVREAIAVGTPVIVSGETNMGELVSQARAGRVLSLNRHEVSQALVEAADPAMVAAWRSGVKNLRDALDWTLVAGEYRKGYEMALRTVDRVP
jgi:glycosyltransferase involved in cell wall biosynthesis